MKSSLAFVLIALQAVTAGVVVALLVGRNDSTSAIEAKFEEWNAKVQGSVNQMRQIVNSQERLRQEYQGHSPGGGGPPTSTGPGPGATQGDPPPAGDPAPPALPAKAFPEATAALAKLKDLERQYRDEVKNSNPQVNSAQGGARQGEVRARRPPRQRGGLRRGRRSTCSPSRRAATRASSFPPTR
jgi:hypothetical protein